MDYQHYKDLSKYIGAMDITDMVLAIIVAVVVMFTAINLIAEPSDYIEHKREVRCFYKLAFIAFVLVIVFRMLVFISYPNFKDIPNDILREQLEVEKQHLINGGK